MKDYPPLETLKRMYKAVQVDEQNASDAYRVAWDNGESEVTLERLDDVRFQLKLLRNRLGYVIDNWTQLCAIRHKRGL